MRKGSIWLKRSDTLGGKVAFGLSETTLVLWLLSKHVLVLSQAKPPMEAGYQRSTDVLFNTVFFVEPYTKKTREARYQRSKGLYHKQWQVWARKSRQKPDIKGAQDFSKQHKNHMLLAKNTKKNVGGRIPKEDRTFIKTLILCEPEKQLEAGYQRSALCLKTCFWKACLHRRSYRVFCLFF